MSNEKHGLLETDIPSLIHQEGNSHVILLPRRRFELRQARNRLDVMRLQHSTRSGQSRS